MWRCIGSTAHCKHSNRSAMIQLFPTPWTVSLHALTATVRLYIAPDWRSRGSFSFCSYTKRVPLWGELISKLQDQIRCQARLWRHALTNWQGFFWTSATCPLQHATVSVDWHPVPLSVLWVASSLSKLTKSKRQGTPCSPTCHWANTEVDNHSQLFEI